MNQEDRRIIKGIKTKLSEINKSLEMLIDFSRDDLRRLQIMEKQLGIKSYSLDEVKELLTEQERRLEKMKEGES